MFLWPGAQSITIWPSLCLTFILKKVMLVSKSTVDFKSWSRSGLPAGKLFCCKLSKFRKGKEIWKPPCQKQWNKKLPLLLPAGIFPSWAEQKSCKTTGLPLFSTDTDRPLPKAGVNNPQPSKQRFLQQPYFPCNVWASAQMKTETHTHIYIYTFFLGKILTPKQWVLQQLQCNYIFWNISGATLQTRLRSRIYSNQSKGRQLFHPPSRARRWQSSEQNCFGVSSLGPSHHASLHSPWHEF